MKTINVNLKNQSYPIFIKRALLSQDFIYDFIKDLASSFVIVSHDNLVDVYGRALQEKLQEKNKNVFLLSFKSGEINKSRKTIFDLQDELIKKSLSKDTCIISLGGGIVSDVAGFLASNYCRGIPIVHIPTTLLAMIDSTIGGKNAINTLHVKNIIGNIYHPKAVFIDLSILDALPYKEYKNGIVELIKHSLIASRDEFKLLQNEKVSDERIIQSILIKKRIVEEDENDLNLRKVLNFGHTIGHALESVLDYKISHGSAVALGIIVESYISKEIGLLSKEGFKEIANLFRSFNLIDRFPIVSFENIKKAFMLDKKTINKKVRFSLIKEIGSAIYNQEVSDDIIEKAFIWTQEEINVSSNYIRS